MSGHWRSMVLLILCSGLLPVPAATRDGAEAEAVRALIVEAEATSSRDLAAATTLANRELTRAESLHDEGLAIYAQLTLADALLKGRRLDEADLLLKRIEERLDAGTDPATEARLVVLRARWLRDLSRIEEAEAAFVRATALAERSADEGLLAIIQNSHAAMLWRQGQADRAVLLLEHALGINQRLGREGEAIKNLSYLSLIARDRGDYDLSLKLNVDVLEISEKRGDLRGVAVAANTIGLLLVHQDELRQSLDYFRRAAEAYRRVGDPSGEGPALANVGTTLVLIGEVDAAVAPLEQALAMSQSTQDPTAEVIARSGLAERALHEKDLAEAERQALASLEASKRQPAASPSVSALRVLATVRRSQQRLAEAVELGRSSLEQARRQGRMRDLRDCLLALAEDLSAVGQHAEAFRMQREATGIIRDMRDAEVRREAARIEDEFEAHRRQAELQAQKQRIESLEAQAEQQRSIRYLLVAVAATFALAVLTLFSRMLLKRRSDRLLMAHTREIERANGELAEAADTDMLTRTRNRRYFHRHLLPMLLRRTLDGLPVTLVLIDADRFKAINDVHGHDVGDKALIALANAWRGVLSDGDTLLRWGGEELLVISPSGEVEGRQLALRGLAAVRAARVEAVPDLRLSVSVGWVSTPWIGVAVDTLLQVADRAMLLAKAEGRDRVIGVHHERPLPLRDGVLPEVLEQIPGITLLRDH